MIKEFQQVLAYREMFKSLVQKDLRARYKGSVLGFAWTLINPLLQLAVYSIVFKFIMKVQVPGYDYSVYLFVGLVPWVSFSSAILMCNSVFVTNANLLKKVYFPRVILPLSVVVSNLTNMLLAFSIVFVVAWFSGAPITFNYLYLLPLVFIQFLLMFGVGLLVGSLFTIFRDLEHLLGIFMMVWMYLSPVLYAPEFILNDWYNVFKLNPMFPLLGGYREIILYGQSPEPVGMLYAASLGALAVCLGYVVYARLQRRFAEEL